MQRSYTLSRKADRAALADRLCEHFARVPGVTIERKEPSPGFERETRIYVSAAGVTASLSLDGDSKWGVIGHWNFDYTTREGRLFTPAFQSLLSPSLAGRAHHKATGPFIGACDARTPFGEDQADVFAATVNRAMRKVLGGSAFEQEAPRRG